MTAQLSRILCLALAAMVAATPLAALSLPSHIYFFGDSQSDTGNLSAISLRVFSVTVPPPPYAEGRFSNGPLWTDTLAVTLARPGDAEYAGATLGPAYNNEEIEGPGRNYAIAGARSGTQGELDESSIPTGLNTQVDYYLSEAGGQIESGALYAILIGGNDIRAAAKEPSPALREAIVRAAVINVEKAAEKLLTPGARSLLISNQRDVGRTPESMALGVQAEATAASLLFNDLLAQMISRLQGRHRAKIRTLDLYTLLNAIYNDAVNNGGAVYGITNVTDPCFTTRTSCAQAMFVDSIHLTTVIHQYMAGEAARALND